MTKTTTHTHGPNFGRKVDGCPRCEELKAGSPAVKGWGTRAREHEAARIRSIWAHDCKASRCGPVCTFGDW